MRHVILGTAGHIDHGKSTLVKALTGIDPDRLKEEKERGITIDIGFADLSYPENDLTVGIVDVPGHEKLINNMLAGAGGIDMVLLVIAADEGIMPQSREHLAICNLLSIKSGLIAITKSDLAEKEWIDLVKDEIVGFVKGTFLENAPVIPVSSRTGSNLDLIKKEIRDLALNVSAKSSQGLFRLPVDRVFSLKGFGTVITGTALSGTVSVEDPLEILPALIRTKVRGLHSHNKSIKTAFAGQRVAINLQGVEKEDIIRGDVAVSPARFIPSKTLDAYLELLKDVPVVKNKSLVHLYTGTSETVARIVLYENEELKSGARCYCQLRLQDAVVAMSGDRYIIRRFSPLETLGGGVILDPAPARRRRKDGIDDLKIIHAGALPEKLSLKIAKAGSKGVSVNSLQGWIHDDLRNLEDAISYLKTNGEIRQLEDLLIHKKAFDDLQHKILELLKSFHQKNPLKPGMPKEEVRTHLKIESRLFNFLLASIQSVSAEKDIIKLREFRIALSSTEESNKSKIIELLDKGGFQPPLKNEISSSLKIDPKRLSDILNILSKEGSAVRISESLYLSTSSYGKMLEGLKAFFLDKPEISVAEFRDMLNTSRKYALPLLEHLDAQNITLRTGDVRKLIMKSQGNSIIKS